MSIERHVQYDDLQEGDLVRVSSGRIPGTKGRTGHFMFAYAEQPQFGNPAEFVVSVDGVARPLQQGEFVRVHPAVPLRNKSAP